MKFRFLFALVFVLLLGLVVAMPAHAADTRSGDEIVIGANEIVNDDLYIFASKITIDGTVKGDVIGAAREIVINGKVEGDLNFGAQTIIVNGTVGDDARLGAQAILIGDKAKIGSDLLAAGSSIEIKAGSTVSGDALVAGEQVLLAGNIGKNVRGAAGAFELRGAVTGDVQIEIGAADDGALASRTFMPPNPSIAIPSIPVGLTIAESARIDGKLTYTSRGEGKIASGAKVMGGATRQEPPLRTKTETTPTPVDLALDHVRRLIALILVGLVLLWLAPAWARQLADTVQAKPLPSLGWGLVAFIAFILCVSVLAVVTLILAIVFGIATLGNLAGATLLIGGLSLAALVIGFGLYVGYVPQIIVSFLGGRLLLERVQPAWATSRVIPLVIGVIILVLLTAIPFLGGLIGLIVTLVGLGALWLWGKTLRAKTASAS